MEVVILLRKVMLNVTYLITHTDKKATFSASREVLPYNVLRYTVTSSLTQVIRDVSNYYKIQVGN